jgi:hypothetical protein
MRGRNLLYDKREPLKTRIIADPDWEPLLERIPRPYGAEEDSYYRLGIQELFPPEEDDTDSDLRNQMKLILGWQAESEQWTIEVAVQMLPSAKQKRLYRGRDGQAAIAAWKLAAETAKDNGWQIGSFISTMIGYVSGSEGNTVPFHQTELERMLSEYAAQRNKS